MKEEKNTETTASQKSPTKKPSLFETNSNVKKLQKIIDAQTKRLDGINKRLDGIDKELQDKTSHLAEITGQTKAIYSQLNKPVTIEYTTSSEDTPMPSPACPGSIGDDIVLVKDFRVPHGRSIIPIDLVLNLPPYIEAKIEARSGFSARGILGTMFYKACKFFGMTIYETCVERLHPADADVLTGKIDPGYLDPIGIIIKNHGVPFTIPAGTHIAQITYYSTVKHKYKKVDNPQAFSKLVPNRKGGWGHTDNVFL